MSEIHDMPMGSTADVPLEHQALEQQYPPQSAGDNPGDSPLDQSSQEASRPSREELLVAFSGWLERRGFDPEDPKEVPRLTMDSLTYDLLRMVPSDSIDYARQRCGIPQEDQQNPQYALIDVGPDASGVGYGLKLVAITDVDFGTSVDYERTFDDFAPSGTDPANPPGPESSGGANRFVDITEALQTSAVGLRSFASTLMDGRTENPFSREHGDFGVRAGTLMRGQEDAFVWTESALTSSLELTIAFPSQYDAVCVVRGEMRDPINGKAGMAQIHGPQEVFRIEGANLAELQRQYQILYAQPDLAVKHEQKVGRNELINHTLVGMIADQAYHNKSRKDAEAAAAAYRPPPPKMRERPLPR